MTNCKWIYVVKDDGKDGAYLASFPDAEQADEYADFIGPANVFKVPYFGGSFPFPTFKPREDA